MNRRIRDPNVRWCERRTPVYGRSRLLDWRALSCKELLMDIELCLVGSLSSVSLVQSLFFYLFASFILVGYLGKYVIVIVAIATKIPMIKRKYRKGRIELSYFLAMSSRISSYDVFLFDPFAHSTTIKLAYPRLSGITAQASTKRDILPVGGFSLDCLIMLHSWKISFQSQFLHWLQTQRLISQQMESL